MPAAAGLLLCDDLLFTSRIVGTAEALGLTVRACASVAALLEEATRERPACVILDLHFPNLDLPVFLERLRAVGGEMPRVMGYGSHVEAETLREARRAGCDLVLPRSAFVERLASDLPAWLGR